MWVVKTLPAEQASLATAKDAPFERITRAMRSRPRKAECPSFMWHTVGVMPIDSSAYMPPMPSMISWRTRNS